MYAPHDLLEHNLTFTAKNVVELMAYCQEEFTPNLHILEDNMVPWLQKCKVGLGLLVKSIHAELNTLKSNYRTMPDKVEWLKQLIKEHYLHIAPEDIALRLPIKKLSNIIE